MTVSLSNSTANKGAQGARDVLIAGIVGAMLLQIPELLPFQDSLVGVLTILSGAASRILFNKLKHFQVKFSGGKLS